MVTHVLARNRVMELPCLILIKTQLLYDVTELLVLTLIIPWGSVVSSVLYAARTIGIIGARIRDIWGRSASCDRTSRNQPERIDVIYRIATDICVDV